MKSFTIRGKLITAVVVTAGLFGAGGAMGIIGVAITKDEMQLARKADLIAQEFLQREIDHLAWVQAAGKFQADSTATTVDVQTDDRLCGCDEAGEIFFERRGVAEMRCWNAAGIVSCDGVKIPEPDPGSALDAMFR